MTRYLLDTNVLINMGRGLCGIREKIAAAEPGNCFVSAVSIAELQVGCELTGNAHEKAVLDFCRNSFQVLPVSESVLSAFAALKAEQTRTGKKVPDFDMLIAATARVHGLTVASADVRHFSLIRNIRLDVWGTMD